MHYLVENPWPATYLFGTAAAICFVLLRITQQGKYLIAGGIALALVGLFWGMDSLWVTDVERVEDTIYGLARAVRDAHPAPERPEGDLASPGQGPRRNRVASPDQEKADQVRIDRALDYLAPDTAFEGGGHSMNGMLARTLVRSVLGTTSFDSLAVTRMEVDLGQQSRKATARFRVYASGTTDGGFNFMTDAQGTDWELGLRETAPGVWKVTRITPLRLPMEAKYLNLPIGR